MPNPHFIRRHDSSRCTVILKDNSPEESFLPHGYPLISHGTPGVIATSGATLSVVAHIAIIQTQI